MTDLDGIVSALQQASEALVEAGSAIAQAEAGANIVRTRAANQGMPAISTQMSGVQALLQRARTTVGPVDVASTVDVVRRASVAPDPGTAVSGLTVAVQQLSTASAAMAAISGQIAAARSAIAAALKGGAPGKLNALLDAADRSVTLATDSFEQAGQRARHLIDKVRSIGEGAAAGPGAVRFTAGTKGAWNAELNRPLQPSTRYLDSITGYAYDTDVQGRVATITGRLVDQDGDRNTYQQRVVGGKDRLSTDDGGHFIATVFRGPGERINLAAMDYNLNRGAWKAMENKWSAALHEGKHIDVRIAVVYERTTMRPIEFEVKYVISGRMPVTRTFKNAPGGK